MNRSVRDGSMGPIRFAVAVHALVLLARNEDVCPSTTLASQVNSHATFLRRVVLQLVRAGIVEAREGRGGGYILGRPPEEITLAEVNRAVKAMDVQANEEVAVDCPGECPVNEGWAVALSEIMAEAEAQVMAVLERHTLAELIERPALSSSDQ